MPMKMILVGALYSCTNFTTPNVQKLDPQCFLPDSTAQPKAGRVVFKTPNSLSKFKSEMMKKSGFEGALY